MVWVERVEESAGVEDGLDDGAAVADEFDVAGREGGEIGGRAELDGDGGESLDEGQEDVRAGEKVGPFDEAVAGGAAGGVDVDEGCWRKHGGRLKKPADVGGAGFEGMREGRGELGGVELKAAEADRA